MRRVLLAVTLLGAAMSGMPAASACHTWSPLNPSCWAHSPQEVIDVIGDECPVLASLAGTYGPVTINGEGDVYIDGEPFWDCPPYNIEN